MKIHCSAAQLSLIVLIGLLGLPVKPVAAQNSSESVAATASQETIPATPTGTIFAGSQIPQVGVTTASAALPDAQVTATIGQISGSAYGEWQPSNDPAISEYTETNGGSQGYFHDTLIVVATGKQQSGTVTLKFTMPLTVQFSSYSTDPDILAEGEVATSGFNVYDISQKGSPGQDLQDAESNYPSSSNKNNATFTLQASVGDIIDISGAAGGGTDHGSGNTGGSGTVSFTANFYMDCLTPGFALYEYDTEPGQPARIVSGTNYTSPPAVALTATPNPATYGHPVTLTATLTPVSPAGATPTGTITFYDASTALGTVPLTPGTGNAALVSLTTSDLPVGTDSLTATYGGDSTYPGGTSAPLTETVNSVTAGTARLLLTPAAASQSGGIVTVHAFLTNAGTAPATNALVTRATLGGIAATAPLPSGITVPAGTSVPVNLTFPSTATGKQAFMVGGKADGGLTFSTGQFVYVR